MATQNPQRRVVFISWNRKQERVWAEMEKRLEELPGIQGAYQLTSWDATASADQQERIHLMERLTKPINSRAQRLCLYLRREPFRVEDEHSDPEVTLVAHGKACSVVKRYLLDLLGDHKEEWRDRRRIRQVIFLSPDRRRLTRMMINAGIFLTLFAILCEILKLKYGEVFGSITSVTVDLFGLLALLLSLLLSAEARQQIGWENFDTDDLDKQFDSRIVQGSKHQVGTWPFLSQTVTMPRLTASTDSVDTIAAAIQNPKGHKNVYEVVKVTVRTEVSPLQTPMTPSGAGNRGPFDNRSDRHEAVQFSEENATAETDLEPYELKYRTNGYLEVPEAPKEAPLNLWDVHDAGVWKAQHQAFIYAFRPEPGVTYTLAGTIYGGFNPGDRQAHMHLDPRRYIKELEYTLDLRGYLTAGWTIPGPPELYYFPPRPPIVLQKDRKFSDQECDCLTTGRHLQDGRRWNVVTKAPGLYQWTVYGICDGGMIGFLFDILPGAAT